MSDIKTTPHALLPGASTMTFHITGTTPLLMSNVRGADKLDPAVKELDALTSRKKAKTISDAEFEAEKSRMQFHIAIYWSEEHGVILPGHNLFRSFMEGASALGRLGTKLDGAVVDFTNECPISPWAEKFDSAEDLFNDGQCTHRVPVKIGQAMVTKTRPMFSQWETHFSLSFLEDQIDPDQVYQAAILAGTLKGVGDGRKRGYGKGRFNVEVV